MSNDQFLKGECRQCAGHLEFPAAAAGQTIACPHCGQPTVLAAPVSANRVSSARRLWLTLAAGAIILIGVAAVFLSSKKSDGTVDSGNAAVPAILEKASAVPMVAKVVKPKPSDEQRTNDFAISPFKLEKTPGSSLVYVTGKIRNLTSRQRFGVKIEFGLFDTNGSVVGKASDYQPVLDPNGDWRFKALVMESQAASARLNTIAEDQQ
jgi:hypothetical protein